MFSKIVSTFGTKFSSALLSFFIVVFLSKFLGADGKGVCSMIVYLIAIITIFNNIVGGPTLVYLVPRYPPLSLFIPSYIWAIIMSSIFWVVIHYIHFIPSEYFIHIFILSLLQSFTSINLMILLGKENIRSNNIISFLQIFIGFIIIAYLFIVEKQINISSYIDSLYVAYSLCFLLSLLMVIKAIRNSEITNHNFNSTLVILQQIFRFGLINQLANIAQFLSYRLSYNFLDYYYGKESVGIFSNGTNLAEAIWLIGGSISLVQYAKVANRGDDSYSIGLTKNFLKFNVVLTFVSLVPLLCIPASVYIFIFGKDFGNIQQVIWCLAPGIFSFSFTMIISSYFSGIGKYYFNAMASALGLLMAIIFCYFLVPHYGIIGAGIASSISYVITSLFMVYKFLRTTHIKWKTCFRQLMIIRTLSMNYSQ